MKLKINYLFFFLICFIFSTEYSCQIKNDKFPKSIGRVSDYAHVFTNMERDSLEYKLINYEKNTTNQIAIIILDSMTIVDSFDQYAVELSNAWGVGQKDKNNGFSIVLSPSLRKIRLNTGIGTEKILTDSICKDILDNIMMPDLKSGNYFNAINNGLNEIIRRWK